MAGLKVKVSAAKEKCLQMDKMKLDLEREKEKVSLRSSYSMNRQYEQMKILSISF